ncbi:hypothetical protein BASA83_013229 [Batrachochytrium salamandrivorans]|nr:hypothetical protein BASA62_002644 [Batrachochytrium salamandrivorans]KAH9263397.1 hypothetical protein BASA83_013229 [Batrachochytrium salamandrivorans]
MTIVVSACSKPPCPATTTADHHLRSHRSQHQRPDQSLASRRAHYFQKYKQRQDQSSTSRSARYLQKYKQTRSNMFKPIIPRPTGFNPAIPRPTGVKPFLPQPTGNQSAIPQPTNSQSTDSQPTGFPSTPQINQHHMEANNQTEPQTSGHLYSEVAPLGLSASAIIMAILAIF